MTIQHAIDSVAINGRMLFGWGWCFSEEAEHTEVQLKLEYCDGSVAWVKCQAGITRVDVLASYPAFRHSVRSGFRFSATLNSDLANARVSLYLMKHDGSWENISLTGFIAVTGSGSLKNREARNKKAELRAFFETIPFNFSSFVLLVDHAMGGGANIASKRWSNEWRQAGSALLSLRFNASRLDFELVYANATENRSISVSDFKQLIPFLDKIGFSRIEVNSLVSYPDVVGMLRFIASQKERKELVLRYYVHDFHCLCDSWSLLNQYEVFCELPGLSICNKCMDSRSEVFPSSRKSESIVGWRSQWKKFLLACDAIHFFSDSSRLLFRRVYKNSVPDGKLLVTPHETLQRLDNAGHPATGNRFIIGVVGNISIAKGANILRDMARLILKEQLPLKIVVIGNVETYEPSEAYFSTGSYAAEELPGLLEEHDVGICFLPSICPETFSFVTSEVMQLQYPLVCFNLGAQAERVGSYNQGFIISEPTAEAALSRILQIANGRETDSLPKISQEYAGVVSA